MLKFTPFHPRTATLCESHAWRRWSGYVVASSYELSHEREYHAIRNAAALIDVSPLYKVLLRGPGAAHLLDRMVTRDVMRCEPGQVLYTTWCDAQGKVLDDGTLSHLGDGLFRLTSADPNLRRIEEISSGLEVALEDVSEKTAALALQGPASRAILERACETDLGMLRYFRLMDVRLRDHPITVSRTGYTGDLGYELWFDAEHALPIWDALMQIGADYGITPAGMLALDMARMEAGLMLMDVDYVPARKALIPAQTSSPYELDLGWTVQLDKAPFVGRDALASEAARGPQWNFVGIEVDWDSLERLYVRKGLAPSLPSTPWRMSVPIYADGHQAGYATSGTWSPLLKKSIALAHVQAPWTASGTCVEMEVTVEHRRERASARVVKKPFFDPPRKRTTDVIEKG